MLVLLIFLLIILIIGLLYLGVALSNTIEKADNKLLFWILYFVTVLSIIQLIICIIFFVKYKNKIGPLGPRGFQGERGEKGDKGTCGTITNSEGVQIQDTNCRKKSLILLIIKRISDKIGRDLNEEEVKLINNFVKTKNLDSTTYEDLRKFNTKLEMQIEILSQEKNLLEGTTTLVKSILVNTDLNDFFE